MISNKTWNVTWNNQVLTPVMLPILTWNNQFLTGVMLQILTYDETWVQWKNQMNGQLKISSNEKSERIIIEKKNLEAVLELTAKQHCQFSLFTAKMGQIGWIGSAVYLVTPKRPTRFWFFQLPWVPNLRFSWTEIHCYLKCQKS